MTSHDEHYRRMPIQPIEVMEQVASNAPDHVSGLRVAMACKYLLRAGTKDDWRKDLEKAANYLHRALHGVWPWDEPDIDAIKKALDNPTKKMCDAEHAIPAQDSGEALVGRECWMWDVQPRTARKATITRFGDIASTYPYQVGHTIYGHARPVELGHPDPGHPEYKG